MRPLIPRLSVRCSTCGSELDRPGDFCLVCRSRNADAVVVVMESERATVTPFAQDTERGTTTITSRTEDEARRRERQERNFVERVAAEVRRKRPDGVYVAGDRALIDRLRGELAVSLFRLDAEDPVAAYRDRQGEPPVPVVDRDPADKLGGRHTTLIGDRRGRRAIRLIADNPHVKKIVPGPIEAGGQGSRTGFTATVTRATPDGNLRALLRDGSSVQTVRIVTTAPDHETGERIATQLNELLGDEGIGR